MHSSENDAVLIFVCEPLNHIHQDTKSARLIAVCKRSITLNKFGKRARGCCVHVFLVHVSRRRFPEPRNSKPPPWANLGKTLSNSTITSDALLSLFRTIYFPPRPATHSISFSSRLGAEICSFWGRHTKRWFQVSLFQKYFAVLGLNVFLQFLVTNAPLLPGFGRPPTDWRVVLDGSPRIGF